MCLDARLVGARHKVGHQQMLLRFPQRSSKSFRRISQTSSFRWICTSYCKVPCNAKMCLCRLLQSNFALRSFCGSETLSHKTPAATRSNAAARGQAFRLITCLRMLRTRKLLNIPPESLRHELGEALQRIQLLIRLNLHASSGYLCPSSRRTSATSS